MSDTPAEGSSAVDPESQANATSQATSSSPTANPIQPLRIWPAVILLIGLWALRIIPAALEEMTFPAMMARFMGPLICSGLLILWWLLLSRATLKEKLIGVVGLIAIAAIANVLADKTVRGFGIFMDAMPWGVSAFAVVLICLAGWRSFKRTGFALVVALLVFGYWDLVRTDEVRGDFRLTRSWRWEPTAEDRYLESLAARASEEPTALQIEGQSLSDPEWAGFRGPDRRGVQPGIVLAEDWDAQPLREVWRVPVGPGWSSYSVAGDLLFTQEQRHELEVVTCRDANNGREIWAHEDEARFWEVIGGAGPRATPTLSDGKLYALGAAGLLNCLDPLTGEQIWHRDLNADAGRKPPQWGYASSPLVTDGVVIVHAGGPGDKGLLAYDVESGDPLWSCAAGDHSYSSPQLAEIDGVSCVMMLTNQGLHFVDPTDGSSLGNHEWEFQGYRVVQPLLFDSRSVLLGTAMGTGTQRIEVRWDGDAFSTEETWTTRRMNPYYNDYVEHQGYLYGFDNNIFACVDLETGERKWKRGRYGNGQVLLLPDADQLLVISEEGELVLLRATAEKLVELARHQAIAGRTWNHPVLVGDRLYVRNGEEAACFEVPVVQ